MRRSLAATAACLAALAVTATLAVALPRSAKITTAGLGPIKIGMTEAQVEQAGGRPITREGDTGAGGCSTATLGTNVSGLFSGTRLARIYVGSPVYTTRKGIRVGDAQRRVIRAYGRSLASAPHKYVRGGRYLTLTIGNRRLLFETDGRHVTQISSGRKPEIDYVEGCA
jgi:hypothetical protein